LSYGRMTEWPRQDYKTGSRPPESAARRRPGGKAATARTSLNDLEVGSSRAPSTLGSGDDGRAVCRRAALGARLVWPLSHPPTWPLRGCRRYRDASAEAATAPSGGPAPAGEDGHPDRVKPTQRSTGPPERDRNYR